MSLFPAYVPVEENEGARLPVEESIVGRKKSLIEEVDDIHYPDVASANSADEATLLETSSESQSEGEVSNRKRKLDVYSNEPASKKRKKKSKRKKGKQEKRVKDESAKMSDDFYMDKKPDSGNLYVSTLYYPARPEFKTLRRRSSSKRTTSEVALQSLQQSRPAKIYAELIYGESAESVTGGILQDMDRYYQSKRGIALSISEQKKSKKRWKRYFEVDIRFINEKNYHTETQDDRTDKTMGEFENIADSKKRWDDSRTEKELTEKTAHYNKYLADNPHDVDKWLEFVQFQENRYSYDVLNYRTTSESGARDACHQKQLSVLDVALSHNSRNMALLDAKLRLARLLKPSPEYLDMLKELIAAETDPSTVARLWCALAEGVFGSSALCSAVTVRDTYTAAVTALRRDQRAYLELLYRYGLFLRHSGLLEQLNLLIDLMTTMNFVPRSNAFNCDSIDKIAEREKYLSEEEAKLTASGLPLSTVWVRVEHLRSELHWRVEATGADRTADPQRWPDAADVADLIAPVTRPGQLFTLAVHILRLARVPLLAGDACSGALLRSLHPITWVSPAWESDASEALLPLLLETAKPSVYCALVARHAARPNYFQHSGYLSFVEKLFEACLEWTSGRERLAILTWWIRFHAALLTLNSDNRGEAARTRKLVQRTLKQYGDSAVAFAEFARLERAACGVDRARQVALTALWSADSASKAERMAIARCVCETSGSSELARAASGWALVCAVLGRSLPLDLSAPPPTKLLQDAFNECELRCGDLWSQASDDLQDLEPIECMLPSDDTEWWMCRYELLSRLKPGHDWVKEHSDLESIGADAKTCRAMRMHEAASAALVMRAGKVKAALARKSLARHPECVRLAVAAGTRPAMPTLPPPPPPSTVAALAAVLPLLLACEESPGQEVCVGAGRRALAAVRSATAAAAPGARCPLLWRLRLEAEARLDGGNARTALYLASDACPAAKELYVSGVSVAPGEFSELTDLLLEKQLRLHTLPEELASV